MEKETIKGYKGFDKDLKCRGYQYEVGKDYEHNGNVKCCENGFHFCEHPLDVFNYYPPSESRFCEVVGSGDCDKGSNDSKVATSKLHIKAEIDLKGIVEAAVRFVFDRVNWKNVENLATGYQGAASATGDRGAASVGGKESVAIVTGKYGKAKGALGCWIVLTERGEWNGETFPIKEVKAFKVDGDKIRVNTYYKLINGEAVEAE